MFGLSFSELVIIAILALILLGPDRLPGAARTFGKGLRQLRRASQDLKDEIETQTQGLTAELEAGTQDLSAQLQAQILSDEIKAIPSSMMPVPGRDRAASASVSPLAALPVPGRDAAPDPPPSAASETAAVEPPPGASEA